MLGTDLKSSPLNRIKPEVRAIDGYHLETHDSAVKLNQNESPFDVPDDLKRQILESVQARPWSRYPAPMPMDLVSALAQHVGWNPEGLIVCNGSNTLLQLVLAVSVGPGTPVVIPSPSFSLYGLYARIFGGNIISVDLAQGFTFDIPAISAAAVREKAHVMLFCSPHSPTGCTLSNEDLGSLLEETDALVLVDEAYGEFNRSTAVDLLAEHANLIVLKTLSKAFASAGIRIGYLLAHPELTREILKGKVPFDVNLFSHAAALEILKHKDLFKERIAAICSERDRVFKALQDTEGLSVYPSSANFILFEVSEPKRVFNSLVEQGVLIRNVTGYPLLSRGLRVSIGTPEENDRFLSALKTALKES